MTWLKTASAFCLCMMVSGCSTAGGHFQWPSFLSKNESPKPAEASKPKIDTKATQAWMDTYEPRLREAVKSSDLRVERRENVLVVTAQVDSSFNPKRPALLLPKTLHPFTGVAKAVEGDPRTAVLILGNGDSSGEDALTRKLSLERAQSVAAIFRMSGLRNDRLMIKGLGSDAPVAANDSPQGRSLNRRIEIILTPQETLLALVARYNTPNVALAQAGANRSTK